MINHIKGKSIQEKLSGIDLNFEKHTVFGSLNLRMYLLPSCPLGGIF